MQIHTLPKGREPVETGVSIRPQVRASRRSRVFWFLTLGAAAGVAAAISIRVLPGLIQESPQNVIYASGRVEGRDVTLAAKEIQARVKTLLVDEGDRVQGGQLLAELESQQLDARYAVLAANLSKADAQIQQALVDVDFTINNSAASIAMAEAALHAAAARLSRSEAVLANNQAEYERQAGLFEQGVVSKSALDQARMNYQTSSADHEATGKDLIQAQANLAMAETSKHMIEVKRQQLLSLREARRAAAAQLAEAQANIEERNIVAPVDGTILSRTVEVGDVVNPGAPIFVMVDMSRLYLKVYVPEPEIPKLKLGDPAEISVDAFPGQTFPARITKIYDQAEFTPKNVETKEERVKLVFGVELTFVRSDPVIKPGMPAECVIRFKNE